VRSGGHSYEAFSTNQHGVVLDMNLFQNLTISSNNIVTAQTGIRLGDFYNRLNDHNNFTAVGGTCPMVGLGGLMLGGGFGYISRKFGLACDRVVGVDVMLWNGTVIHANTSVYSDLYWACRGGGGGNFGVVTSLDIAPISNLGQVTFFYVNTLTNDLKAFLNTPAMLALTTGKKVTITTKVGGYNSFLQQEQPRDDRQWFKATNNYIAESSLLPFASLQTLYKEAMQNVSYKPQLVQFHAYGAKSQVNMVKPTDTAFPHRAMAWHLQTYTTTNKMPGYSTFMERYNWITHGLFPDAQYIDYVDSWLNDEENPGAYMNSYYNVNAERLRGVKKMYDPFRAFDFPQAIR